MTIKDVSTASEKMKIYLPVNSSLLRIIHLRRCFLALVAPLREIWRCGFDERGQVVIAAGGVIALFRNGSAPLFWRQLPLLQIATQIYLQ